MSPESQRVALAELCGWRFKEMVGWSQHFGPPPEFSAVGMSLETLFSLPPDYLNDMNAIHEVIVNFPSDGSWTRFLIELENALNCAGQPSSTYQFMMVNASAEKRCIAVLKACDKWVEAK